MILQVALGLADQAPTVLRRLVICNVWVLGLPTPPPQKKKKKKVGKIMVQHLINCGSFSRLGLFEVPNILRHPSRMTLTGTLEN